MNITFISNYLTHHQLPFCLAMHKRLGQGFHFISTQPMETERKKMGWKIDETVAPFEIKAYESKENEATSKQLSYESDVVIIGSASDVYIIPRLKADKLTFKYSERPYKKGINVKNLPHILAGTWLHHGRFQNKPLYMLCASGYTASDFAKFGCYKDKCYEWGYFPEAKRYDLTKLMAQKLATRENELKHPNTSILWAGRLIGLKHPDASIRVAERLKREGYPFVMSIIGNGEMERQLCTMIKEKKLEDCVKMLGSMPPEQVRKHMEGADIFLFTSDFNEGWGAVLNEAMNSACAVVVSHAVGSVPFLVQSKKNGLIYENGNEEDLYQKVKWLIQHPEERRQLAANAYQSIVEQWNAENASRHLCVLCESILAGNKTNYKEGPCSPAPIITQKQMYQYLTKGDSENDLSRV